MTFLGDHFMFQFSGFWNTIFIIIKLSIATVVIGVIYYFLFLKGKTRKVLVKRMALGGALQLLPLMYMLAYMLTDKNLAIVIALISVIGWEIYIKKIFINFIPDIEFYDEEREKANSISSLNAEQVMSTYGMVAFVMIILTCFAFYIFL